MNTYIAYGNGFDEAPLSAGELIPVTINGMEVEVEFIGVTSKGAVVVMDTADRSFHEIAPDNKTFKVE